MRPVAPKIFILAETMAYLSGVKAYLEAVGSKDWATDSPTDIEGLSEIIGRACYRSYSIEGNKNLDKVRSGNAQYLTNIIKSKHGSVLEHCWVTFAIVDVSRVLTHELVRHRVGTAVSQESLRFVRTDEISFWMPDLIVDSEESPNDKGGIFSKMTRALIALEDVYKDLVNQVNLDESKDFKRKKKWTSALRRMLPQGMATTIIWSTNMRNLRHVIEARTDPAAEEELRLVFGHIGGIAVVRWPHLFADYKVEVVDGHPWYHTENAKV